MLVKINDVTEGFTNLEVKQYLPFGIKHILINTILESCIIEKDGINRIDFSILEMMKQYLIVNNYTNLDLTENEILDSFDELLLKGIIEYVLNNIPSNELDFYDKILNQEINQIIKLDNSIESIVAKVLNQLLIKLPDEKGMNKLIKDLPKQLNKINSEKLKYITQAIGWNKGVENAGI